APPAPTPTPARWGPPAALCARIEPMVRAGSACPSVTPSLGWVMVGSGRACAALRALRACAALEIPGLGREMAKAPGGDAREWAHLDRHVLAMGCHAGQPGEHRP